MTIDEDEASGLHSTQGETLSLLAYRRQNLGRLKLKTVVKESHGSPVMSVVSNNIDAECANLFASTGGNQATVYDDQHMGDSICIVVHYTNEKSAHVPGGGLSVCAWLAAKDWSPHSGGDALLAVSGQDHVISVISVVEAKVLYQLKGHRKEVVQLASCKSKDRRLASLSKDGDLCLWDVPTASCLAKTKLPTATSMAMHPSGDYIVVGDRTGHLQTYGTPSTLPEGVNGGTNHADETTSFEVQGSSLGRPHTNAVCCLEFVEGDRLLAVSICGECTVLGLKGQPNVAWKVPGCSSYSRCKMGMTRDGEIACIGNSKGSVYVYESRTGALLAQATPPKVEGPIGGCALSGDCRHLLVAAGNGFIFRFEATAAQAKDEAVAEPEE